MRHCDRDSRVPLGAVLEKVTGLRQTAKSTADIQHVQRLTQEMHAADSGTKP